MTKLKTALAWTGRAILSVYGFAVTHGSELAAAGAWLSSLPLPSPYHQVASLLALAFAAIAGTKYGS